MPAEIDKLDAKEKEILLRAPAMVALLAAVSDDGKVSNQEKSESIRLAHLRTYSSPPILKNYYTEVDKVFEKIFDEEMAKLPEGMEAQKNYLEERLTDLKNVLPKLDEVYGKELVNSLKSFSKDVFRSNSNILDYFILPIFMNKIEKESFNPKIG